MRPTVVVVTPGKPASKLVGRDDSDVFHGEVLRFVGAARGDESED